MSDDSVFGRLRARGEELFGQVSNELMNNPQFVKAMQAAMRGKEKLDEAVAQALKTMNVPTRAEFKRALERIEALERQVKATRRSAKRRPAGRSRPA